MKSLDYSFSDQNTAVFPQKPVTDRHKQKLEAAAYRQKILTERQQGNLRASADALSIDVMELQRKGQPQVDVTKSPGFRREKQIDKQRKKEKKEEAKVAAAEVDENKSSFLQCTFNMANILMVRRLRNCGASIVDSS